VEITVQAIDSLTTNVSVARNGKDLVNKNKYSNLKISEDGSLIWGECAGSGAVPYFCSVDYADSNNPVFRCNCPSRLFPCKHSIGLLYARAKGLSFTVSDVPTEIVAKRNKMKQSKDKTEQEKLNVNDTTSGHVSKPKNLKSIIKKAELQLLGIEIARTLLRNIVQMGLSELDSANRLMIAGRIQELGNYHIEGIQLAFDSLFVELDEMKDDDSSGVINQLNYISALLKKSQEYLTSKKENPESQPDLTSAIEEQTGYVWKLADLMKYGMYEENAEIIQLSYNTYDNMGRRAFIDEGYWFNLKSGKIYRSKNYRPYRALRYIKEDNTCFDVLQIPTLFIYPGDVNPRARWESQQLRLTTNDDRLKVLDCSSSDYAGVVKMAKSTIKNPLMEKNHVTLLRLHKAYLVGEHIVLEDPQGNKLTVVDFPERQICTETSLKSILPGDCENIVLAAMINNNISTGLFAVTALSLIVPEKIIRLLY
jgi:hypothetical protein